MPEESVASTTAVARPSAPFSAVRLGLAARLGWAARRGLEIVVMTAIFAAASRPWRRSWTTQRTTPTWW